MRREVAEFFDDPPFAVVGASRDRQKFGNQVLRAYLRAGLPVHCVHPTEPEIEGVPCVRSVAELPDGIRGLSIITPPPVTERVVGEAAARGIGRLWMQPGAESEAAIARARELGLAVIAGGPCVLIEIDRPRR